LVAFERQFGVRFSVTAMGMPQKEAFENRIFMLKRERRNVSFLLQGA
jgi:hypothetical protein